MRALMPCEVILTLEAFQAIGAPGEGTEVVALLRMRALDMPPQVLSGNEGGAADAAYASSRAMPALMMTVMSSVTGCKRPSLGILTPTPPCS